MIRPALEGVPLPGQAPGLQPTRHLDPPGLIHQLEEEGVMKGRSDALVWAWVQGWHCQDPAQSMFLIGSSSKQLPQPAGASGPTC